MESESSPVTEGETYGAEPEIVEVLLRNKTSRARAVRARGVEVQRGSACGRLSPTESAQPNTNALDRSSCERCNWPSRLWLHHTCRVAKTAWRRDQNPCITTAKPKTRNTSHAPGKLMVQRRLQTASSVALSFVPAVMPQCSSDEGGDTDQRESAACSLQRGQRLASAPADTVAIACRTAKSPEPRGRKSSSAQNCGLDTRLPSDKVNPELARVEKSVECSGLLQRPGPVLQQNAVQRTTLPRPGTENGRRFVSPFAGARPCAREQCSAAGRDVDEHHAMAIEGLPTKCEGAAEPIQVRCHASSFRHCSRSAAEAAQHPCQDLSLTDTEKQCRSRLYGKKGDFGASTEERHLQTDVEVGRPVATRMPTSHNPPFWRYTTHSLPWYTARKRSDRKFEQEGAASWPRAACRNQKGIIRDVRETRNYVDVIIGSVGNSSAFQISATERVDQKELYLTKRKLHGASSSTCKRLNDDKQTECSDESFVTNRASDAATADGTGILQAARGVEGSTGDKATHSIASGKSSSTNSYIFIRKDEQEVKPIMRGASAVRVSDGPNKFETTGLRYRKKAMSCGSLYSNRERLSNECLKAEISASASFAVPKGQLGGKAARALSAAEQPTASHNETHLERRIEQPGLVAETQNVPHGTKRREFVACSTTDTRTQLACLCERVGQFLDTVECFLQEPDPQLRREKLYGLHALFVSVEAG